jgi:transcriptional regulator with XRE-family HTH domain
MLAPAVKDGLDRYAIGERLRSLRLRKRMGLEELGGHSGLSAALISKLERGKLFPTLPTLLRLAMVFGVGLEHFFADPRRKLAVAVVRAKDRIRIRDRSYDFESLDFAANDRKLSAYLAFFKEAPRGPSKPHQHPGAELVFVLRGVLGIEILGEERELRRGDSIYFESHAPHAYRRIGKSPCEAMVVATSPA